LVHNVDTLSPPEAKRLACQHNPSTSKLRPKPLTPVPKSFRSSALKGCPTRGTTWSRKMVKASVSNSTGMMPMPSLSRARWCRTRARFWARTWSRRARRQGRLERVEGTSFFLSPLPEGDFRGTMRYMIDLIREMVKIFVVQRPLFVPRKFCPFLQQNQICTTLFREKRL